jgi:hypothetical protein
VSKQKPPPRPWFVRCGDKKKIAGVIMLTALAMVRHWRELPAIWKETGNGPTQ